MGQETEVVRSFIEHWSKAKACEMANSQFFVKDLLRGSGAWDDAMLRTTYLPEILESLVVLGRTRQTGETFST